MCAASWRSRSIMIAGASTPPSATGIRMQGRSRPTTIGLVAVSQNATDALPGSSWASRRSSSSERCAPRRMRSAWRQPCQSLVRLHRNPSSQTSANPPATSAGPGRNRGRDAIAATNSVDGPANGTCMRADLVDGSLTPAGMEACGSRTASGEAAASRKASRTTHECASALCLPLRDQATSTSSNAPCQRCWSATIKPRSSACAVIWRVPRPRTHPALPGGP